MTAIEVDFDVYKALTNLRPTEAVTYNDVLRKLLKLGPAASNASAGGNGGGGGGCVFKGVSLPNGTQLRAPYKGRTYTAEIKDGQWIDASGETRTSPSQAADKITGNSVNGWRFWQAKRPGDSSWRILDDLRS